LDCLGSALLNLVRLAFVPCLLSDLISEKDTNA